jgi:hypothetical protein
LYLGPCELPIFSAIEDEDGLLKLFGKRLK